MFQVFAGFLIFSMVLSPCLSQLTEPFSKALGPVDRSYSYKTDNLSIKELPQKILSQPALNQLNRFNTQTEKFINSPLTMPKISPATKSGISFLMYFISLSTMLCCLLSVAVMLRIRIF